MRIGLFGGSFNPVHEGHRLVVMECRKRLLLHRIWVLVSPGNPLKDHSELAPLDERVLAARELFRNESYVDVTGFEAAHSLRYTYDTLAFLKKRTASTRLVWIMGSDNFADFDRWERWRDIAELVPMAIYARPGSDMNAARSMAGTALARYRLDEGDAAALADCDPPAWVFLRGTKSPLSSSEIRARRKNRSDLK